MSIRITGGEWRGRVIDSPRGDRLRPTASQSRQAIFNSLQGLIAWEKDPLRVLDLFAGTGALGFEALSRGFTELVSVELDRVHAQLIKKNAEALGAKDKVQVLGPGFDIKKLKDASQRRRVGVFELVLADPPYAGGFEDFLLSEDLQVEEMLTPQGIFILEWSPLKAGREPALPDQVRSLRKIREKSYGDTVLSTFIKEA